ncbi:MAG: S41 family peptidase [Planctomycetota bacterium]
MRIAFSLGRKWIWLTLLVGICLKSAPAPAQVRIPAAAVANQETLEGVLRQGKLMEEERRWRDALDHYQDALRGHPEWRELRHRLAVARTHMDVARRYSDSSFVESVRKLSEQEAQDLLSEVLLKIDTYHVSTPAWDELVARGVLNLRIAPSEPAFVNRFPQPVSAEVSDRFTQDVERILDGNRIQSRLQAQEVIASITPIAVRDLSVSPQAAVLEFTCAAVHSLDQYSSYLTGEQLDEVFSQIEGSFVGLGIELKTEDDDLLIVDVIPGGPAEEAGIAPRDRIIEVDGKTTREVSTDTAADMLKGPALSDVELVIRSPDGTARRERIQRRRVEVPSVQDVKMLDEADGVAYLKIASFQKSTSRDVDSALWKLQRQGMRSLIVDVRGNPGGLLNASVEVADKFLTDGAIVSTRGRNGREDFDYRAHEVGTWRIPLIVLIDHDSASASEIFAGAIHDQRRGTVVGQRSYGKGSVQGIFPLSQYKAGIRVTTAKFCSPSGREISHGGVVPDIVVEEEARHVVARPTEGAEIPADEADSTLEMALDVARKSTNYTAAGPR